MSEPDVSMGGVGQSAAPAGPPMQTPVLFHAPGGRVQYLYGHTTTREEEMSLSYKYFGVDVMGVKRRTALVKRDVLKPILELLANNAVSGEAISDETLTPFINKYKEHCGGATLPMVESLLRERDKVEGTYYSLQLGQCPAGDDRGADSKSLYTRSSNGKVWDCVAEGLAQVSSDNTVTVDSEDASSGKPMTVVSDEARGFCTGLTVGMPVIGEDGEPKVLYTEEERCIHAGCWDATNRKKRGMMYWSTEWKDSERVRIMIIVAIAACLRMRLIHILCYGTMSSLLVAGGGLFEKGTHISTCCPEFLSLAELDSRFGITSPPPVTVSLHSSYWPYAARKWENNSTLLPMLAATYHHHNEVVVRHVAESIPALRDAPAVVTAMVASSRAASCCRVLDNAKTSSECSPLDVPALKSFSIHGDILYFDPSDEQLELERAKREVAAAVLKTQGCVLKGANALPMGAAQHSSQSEPEAECKMLPVDLKEGVVELAVASESLFRGAPQLNAGLKVDKAFSMLSSVVRQNGRDTCVFLAPDTTTNMSPESTTINFRLWAVGGVVPFLESSGELDLTGKQVLAPLQNRRQRRLGAQNRRLFKMRKRGGKKPIDDEEEEGHSASLHQGAIQQLCQFIRGALIGTSKSAVVVAVWCSTATINRKCE